MNKRTQDRVEDFSCLNQALHRAAAAIEDIVKVRAIWFGGWPTVTVAGKPDPTYNQAFPPHTETGVPGILVCHGNDDRKEYNEAVILAPEGLFVCRYISTSMPGQRNSFRAQPDWNNRETSNGIWARYGQDALGAVHDLIRERSS